MKHIAYIVTSVLLILFIIVGIFALGSSYRRTDETEVNLDKAVDNAINTMFENKEYTIHNEEQFAADLIEELSEEQKSDSTFTADIKNADLENGYIYVYVTETYKQLDGSVNTVDCTENVIFDPDIVTVVNNYTVTFKSFNNDGTQRDEPYRQYTYEEGEAIFVPSAPEVENKHFIEWNTKKDGSGEKLVSGLKATKSITYYAIYS